MKNLLLTLSLFASFNVSAALNIRTIELKDYSVIDGKDISAITINENNETIHSVELNNGLEISGSEIKSLKINSKASIRAVSKVGGEGSGG